MKILSLDFGSHSIKALEMESGFSGHEVQDYHVLPLSGAADQNWENQLTQFMNRLPKKPDRVVVSLPTQAVTFRNLIVPSRDKKAVQAAVRFELEDELPFDLESAVFEYSTLKTNKLGTTIHVAATLTKTLEAYLQRLNAAHCDPEVVTTEAWSFLSLMDRISPTTKEAPEMPATLVVQIGHSRTLLYGQNGITPLFVREIAWGGKELTEVIAQAMSVPLEVAEKLLCEKAALLPESEIAGASQEARVLSMSIQSVLEPLLLEIRQGLIMIKNACGKNPERIMTSGGVSQLPGLWNELSKWLSVPVSPLLSLSAAVHSGITYSENNDAIFACAMGQALALVGPKKSLTTNFRRGAMQKKSAATPIIPLDKLRVPARAMAIAAGCLCLTLGIENYIYSARIEAMQNDLERAIKGFFGSVSPSAVRQYLASTTSLKTALNREITKQRDIAKVLSPPEKSALDPLLSLSRKVGKDIPTDLMHYQVGAAPEPAPRSKTSAPAPAVRAEPVELTFWVSSAQMAERLSSTAGQLLEDFDRGKIEEITTPGGEKRYKVPLTGRVKRNGGTL